MLPGGLPLSQERNCLRLSTVKFFEAKHGKKGHKVKEMGTLLRAQGIPDSDNTFKTQMVEMLAWNEVHVLKIFTVPNHSDTFKHIL